MATWIIERCRERTLHVDLPEQRKADWMTIADELSKEPNPAKVLELSKQLLEALHKARQDKSDNKTQFDHFPK